MTRTTTADILADLLDREDRARAEASRAERILARPADRRIVQSPFVRRALAAELPAKELGR